MNVIVSALSPAFTVMASSLPAHFRIFDMLQKLNRSSRKNHSTACELHMINRTESIGATKRTHHTLQVQVSSQENSSQNTGLAASILYGSILTLNLDH